MVEKEIKVLEDGMRVDFSINIQDNTKVGFWIVKSLYGNGFSHVSRNTRVV